MHIKLELLTMTRSVIKISKEFNFTLPENEPPAHQITVYFVPSFNECCDYCAAG